MDIGFGNVSAVAYSDFDNFLRGNTSNKIAIAGHEGLYIWNYDGTKVYDDYQFIPLPETSINDITFTKYVYSRSETEHEE